MSIKKTEKRPSRESTARGAKEPALAFQQNQIDLIFVLQYAIRRFKSQCPSDFSALMTLRKELDSVLNAIPSFRKPDFGVTSNARILNALMNFWANEDDLTESKQGQLKDKLLNALDFSHLQHNAAEEYFSERDLERLSNILTSASSMKKILNRYNYFEYYSPFAMSCFIPGKVFYRHYVGAKLGIYTAREVFSSTAHTPESCWLLTGEAKNDPHLASMLDTNCYFPGTNRENIEIFGGSRNRVEVDGKRLTNKLILSIPFDESPRHIDRMLTRFRATLIEEAIFENGGYHGISSPGFDNSEFMNHLPHSHCLVVRWDQVQRHMLGLWAWDEIEDSGKTPELICGNIANAVQTWKAELEEDIDFPEDRTLLDNYRQAAIEIIPVTEGQSTKIDTYLLEHPYDVLGSPPSRTDMEEWADLHEENLSGQTFNHVENDDDFDKTNVLAILGCVNFSNDKELDEHLNKVKKDATKANREILRLINKELEKMIGIKDLVTHDFFHHHLLTQLDRLK